MKSSDIVENYSKEYAIYTVKNRAIPSLCDGLKPVHRYALISLQGIKKPIKTIGLVGDMMRSNLYVHGDAAAASAISHMAAPYLNNYNLIKGHGNFGSRTNPSEWGSPRYTEVGHSKFTEEMYVDHEIAPRGPNYDGSTMVIESYLPRVPIVLLNGANGIAVGFATNILPRKLDDVVSAVKDTIRTGKCDPDKHPLVPWYNGYDVDVSRDHKNPKKFHLRGKAEIVNTTTVRITEIPPRVSLETVVEKLNTLVDNGKIKSFTDKSTDRINIEVKMTRNELSKHDKDSIVTFLGVSTTATENITLIHPETNKVMVLDSPQEVIEEFVKYRFPFYKSRYERLVIKEEDRALFLLSYLACFDGGKKSVAANISSIKSRSDMKDKVSEAIRKSGIEVVKDNVEKIVNMPVYKFTGEHKKEYEKELDNCLKLLDEYDEILSNEASRVAIACDELNELVKYWNKAGNQ